MSRPGQKGGLPLRRAGPRLAVDPLESGVWLSFIGATEQDQLAAAIDGGLDLAQERVEIGYQVRLIDEGQGRRVAVTGIGGEYPYHRTVGQGARRGSIGLDKWGRGPHPV